MITLVSCALLAACVQSAPIEQVPSTSSASVDGLTCSDLTTRNARIGERLRQLEQEGQQTASNNALKSAALNIGLGALLGQSVGGGVNAIRTASAIGGGMSAVLAAEAGQQQMETVSDTLALARRSADLQRAMIERGC